MSKRRNIKKPYNDASTKTNIPAILPAGLSIGMPTPGFGFTLDGFSNPLARMGSGSQSLLEATSYTMSKMTKNYQLLNTLYRENWVVKRIIDTIPEDMTKNWYKIETQLPPDDVRRFKMIERTTGIRAKILEGLKWGRLYGGAAAVMIIDGQDDMLDKPLELDTIMPGSFKGLIILDRWSGISASLSLVTDTSDPDFGLPKYYTISADALGSGIKVHHSRILRFMGRDLPYIEKVGEQYWGASELEHVYEELKKRDNTSWNIATLIFSANLKVYKMEGMDQLALMPDRVQRDLYTVMSFLNTMMNSNGMQIIGKDDSFETHQYSFAGLSDIYELFMLDVAGAAETPVTKLFGRSPAGMNATGESDMQNYYDVIEEKQESYLRPVIDKLLPVICMSVFGKIPDDLDYSFVNCRRPTEDEKKNLAQQISTAVIGVYNAGIISHKTALKELKASSELTGMWSNITDEDIEKADGEFSMGGENTGFERMFGDVKQEDSNNEYTYRTPTDFENALDTKKNFLCSDSDKNNHCRAKDPAKCPVHGNNEAISESSSESGSENPIDKSGNTNKIKIGSIPKERLKHISTGTFKNGQLKSGCHGQKGFIALNNQGLLNNVRTLKNGVRIANVKDHRDKSKAEHQGQTFFPDSWDDNKISTAIKTVWRKNADKIPAKGYHKFDDVFEGIKITVGFKDGKPDNAYPNNDQR